LREQSDQALRASLRKVFGSTPALRGLELRRRLLSIPELFYYADELVEESVSRGILRAVPEPETPPDRTAAPGAVGAVPADGWLEIAGSTGNLDAWP
jgi:hypothetical protein